MPTLRKEYAAFYLEGRDATRLRADIDDEELAERVLKGGDLHAVLLAAAEDAAKPLAHDRKKRVWLSDNEEAITEAGGDGEEAYLHFVKGKVDELVCILEPSVIEAMSDLVFGDDDEEDDEDGEGDDEDDEDEKPAS